MALTIDPADLPNTALLDALRACEIGIERSASAEEARRRYAFNPYGGIRITNAGRALAAEAWARGLISAPQPPNGGDDEAESDPRGEEA